MNLRRAPAAGSSAGHLSQRPFVLVESQPLDASVWPCGLTLVHNLLWKLSQSRESLYKNRVDHTSEIIKAKRPSLAVVNQASKRPTNLNKCEGNIALVNIKLYEQSCPIDLSYFAAIVTDGRGYSWFITSLLNYRTRWRIVNFPSPFIYLFTVTDSELLEPTSLIYLNTTWFKIKTHAFNILFNNKCSRIKFKLISVSFEVWTEKTNKAIKKAFIEATSRHAS